MEKTVRIFSTSEKIFLIIRKSRTIILRIGQWYQQYHLVLVLGVGVLVYTIRNLPTSILRLCQGFASSKFSLLMKF